MSELIDRQDAIDRFNVIRPVDSKKDEYTKGIDVGIAMCIVAVKDQPTVQPEPTDEQVEEYCKRRCLHVVTDDFFRTIQPEPHEGEWINTNPEYKNGFYNNSYYCSECHDYYTTSPHEMKFCPNCGAKMTISTK